MMRFARHSFLQGRESWRDWASWFQLLHIHAGRRRLEKLPKFHFLSPWLYINRKSQQLWIILLIFLVTAHSRKDWPGPRQASGFVPNATKKALISSLRSGCFSLSLRFVGHFQNPISMPKIPSVFSQWLASCLRFHTHTFHSSLPAFCFLLRNEHKTNAIF